MAEPTRMSISSSRLTKRPGGVKVVGGVCGVGWGKGLRGCAGKPTNTDTNTDAFNHHHHPKRRKRARALPLPRFSSHSSFYATTQSQKHRARTLDARAVVGQVLAAGVLDRLLPHPLVPLRLEARHAGLALLHRVDAHALEAVVGDDRQRVRRPA